MTDLENSMFFTNLFKLFVKDNIGFVIFFTPKQPVDLQPHYIEINDSQTFTKRIQNPF